MGKYLLLWFPMILIAIANGALRETWIRKHVDELRAHQISTLSLLVLFALYTWVVVRVWPPASPGHALAVGLLWLGLTLGFEILFGRYVSGSSWSTLLNDYNLLAGRLWVLVPLWLAAAPYLWFRLRP